MKKVLLTFLTLGLLGGVASADHFRGGRGGGWGHNGGRATWSGGVRVHSAPVRVYSPRVYSPRVYTNSYRVVRRPIFVERPVIRYRYYNYYQRPAVIVENYPARDGYYWVAGQWSWTGYEWTWTPGHYEPDPNWVQPGYYDNGYSYDYNYNDGSTSVNVSSPGYSYDYNYQP